MLAAIPAAASAAAEAFATIDVVTSPADRTVVHLMRHGEVHNPDGVLYGRLDGYHLSDLGHEMARTVADHLADHDVTHVVASSLLRAQETATPVAEAHGIPITTDDRVIEAGNAFEGQRSAAMKPLDFLRPAHWSKLVNPLRPSWGEPYAEIADADGRRHRRRPRRRPAATRPSSSPTSCRSGPPATP